MKARGATCGVLSALLFIAVKAPCQTIATNAASATNSSLVTIEDAPGKAWSFSASVSTYIVPEERDYAQPTVIADHDRLHLEARYNYEGLETGSAWLGYNFWGGGKLAWNFTPMLGGVFGNTTGIAPGYRGSLTWRKLEFNTEVEYVFDIGDAAQNYVYAWSELALVPVEWFRFGLVAERTHVDGVTRAVEPGLLAGFTYKHTSLTTYVLNPDQGRPTVVVAISLLY